MKKIFLIIVGLSVVLFAGFSKRGNIVTDSTTGLQWQDDKMSSEYSYRGAILYCEELVLDGYSDWRLPNINELTSLVDDSRKPSISPTFKYVALDYNFKRKYWSSTRRTGVGSNWVIRFDDGIHDSGSGTYRVRCVRGG